MPPLSLLNVRPEPGHLSSALTALLLVLTLGVGVGEAWHADEHADEGNCAECVLCHVTTQGPASEPTGLADLLRADCVDSADDVTPAIRQLATEHRSDAPRAPPV